MEVGTLVWVRNPSFQHEHDDELWLPGTITAEVFNVVMNSNLDCIARSAMHETTPFSLLYYLTSSTDL